MNSEKEYKFLAYFSPNVIASYRNEPDKFIVETDYLSGRITLTDSYNKSLRKKNKGKVPQENIRLRFGYRTLKNGEMAIAAFLPDLFQDSKSHIERWRGYFMEKPIFSSKKDKRFEMWKESAFMGKWDGKFPITRKISDIILFLNSLTKETLGKPFFRYQKIKIDFPMAQNTISYQNAHAKIYGFLIDGISMETLSLLTSKIDTPRDLKGNQTLIELRKILPELEHSKYFLKIVSFIRKQRSISAHGVPDEAIKYNAFEKFSKDLTLIYKGYRELLFLLEKKLNMKGKVAKSRVELKEMLPVIVKAPEHNYSINKARHMIGKKILDVSYGHRKSYENVHESEAFVITFTDGSILGIESGSNASNVSWKKSKIRPTDFHVDFSLSWVPATKYKKRDYDKYGNPLIIEH